MARDLPVRSPLIDMPRSWPDKFRDAFRGLGLALRREHSFAVHLPMTAAVAICGAWLRVSLLEGCILGLCVTVVLVAEVFNTAIEYLSREITRQQRPGIAAALEMASGAVLLASLGAAAIGVVVLGGRLGLILGWWTAPQ
jgi:diacylglycerol kinase